MDRGGWYLKYGIKTDSVNETNEKSGIKKGLGFG